MATELELKLMVHPDFLKLACDFLDNFCQNSTEVNNARQPTLALMNAYFDTEDALLMQTGIAMRIRSVGSQFIQTVKTRGSSRVGMHARGEWEWPLTSDQLDFSLLKDVPLPEDLQDLAWQSRLTTVYRTDFERQIWNVGVQETQMEVVCDQGEVTSPYGKDKISELELELKSGDETHLYSFALSLAESVPVQVSVVSKAQKGVRLKHGKIEFPDQPKDHNNPLELAAFWYETWLIYWEAMHFMQDSILLQPVRHSMLELKKGLPEDLVFMVDKLDKAMLDCSAEEESLLSKLASMTEVGVVMLMVGQWLNQQHTNKV